MSQFLGGRRGFSMWDAESNLTKDQTHVPAVEGRVLNTEPLGSPQEQVNI